MISQPRVTRQQRRAIARRLHKDLLHKQKLIALKSRRKGGAAAIRVPETQS